MSAHKRLSQQLRTSVAQTNGLRLGLRSRLRLWAGGLPVLVIVASTTVAVAAAAVSIEVAKPKGPGSPPHNVSSTLVNEAMARAWGKDGLCYSGPLTRGAHTTSGTPGPAFFSELPILRRPRTAADGVPWPFKVSQVAPGRGEAYKRYIRRARVVDGIKFYLVPVNRAGSPPLSAAAANRCYQLMVNDLRADLSRVPVARRAPTRRFGDAEYAVLRYDLEHSHVHGGVYLLYSGREDSGIGGGQSPATIRRVGEISGFGGPGKPRMVDGIVPPGVATVTLRFPAKHYEGRRLRELTVSGNVVNNVFAIPVGTLFERGGVPASEVWRSPSGKVIKTIKGKGLQP